VRKIPQPPFVIDFDYLTAAIVGTEPGYRLISAATVQMCIAALDAMHFNRYWLASGEYLTSGQQDTRDALVDGAILELLEAVTITCEDAERVLSGGAGGGGCEEYESENDMSLNLITIGGQTYLVKPSTCCGDDLLFPLGQPVNVRVGAGGGAVVASGSDSDTGITFDSVPDDNLTCYANKAVPYLLGRAYEFFETSDGILNYGLDILAGGIDELFDLGSIVTDLLGTDETGAVDTLRNFDSAQVYGVYTDAEFVAVMVERWTDMGYRGAVSRDDLQAWAGSAPSTWDGVPVRGLLENWVSRSIILRYNQDLQVFAAECKTGQTLDDVNEDQESWNAYSEHVGGTTGLTYPVWFREPGIVIGVNQEYVSPDAPTGSILAIATDITVGVSGNFGIAFDGHSGAGWTGIPGGSSRQYWSITDGTNWEEVSAIIEQFITGLDGGGASVGADSQNKVFWQSAGSCTLNKLVVVGLPLS